MTPGPTSTRVTIVAGAGRPTWGNKRIVVAQPKSGWAHVTSQDMAAIAPTWSPDGNQLAYSAGPNLTGVFGGQAARQALMDRSIWLMAADEGETRRLTDGTNCRDERPLWSGDGSHLLFARLDANDRASLWVVPAEGGDPQQVVDELTPAPDWFGTYGHVEWHQWFDWWRGPGGQ